METKECNRCNIEKPIIDFRQTKRWRGNICRSCRNEQRKYRWHNVEKHKPELVEYNRNKARLWRENTDNRSSLSETARTWRNSTDKGYWANKLTSIKANCRQRGMECTLTRTDLVELYEKQNGKCAVTGRELLKTRIKAQLDTCSVDRIDSSKDYHLDNIRLITHQANLSKWNGTDDELLSFCKDVITTLDPYFYEKGNL
jgi:hypothetical protein